MRTFTGHTGSISYASVVVGPSSSEISSIKNKRRKKCILFATESHSSLFHLQSSQHYIKMWWMDLLTYLPSSDSHAQDNDANHQENRNQAANTNRNPHPPGEPQQPRWSIIVTAWKPNRLLKHKCQIHIQWRITVSRSCDKLYAHATQVFSLLPFGLDGDFVVVVVVVGSEEQKHTSLCFFDHICTQGFSFLVPVYYLVLWWSDSH